MAVAADFSEAMLELSVQLLLPVREGLRVTEQAAGLWLGTATLISPRLAITPAELLDRGHDRSESVRVRRAGRSGDVNATIVPDPSEPALSLIELDGDLAIKAGEESLLLSAELRPGAEWEAAFAPPQSRGALRAAHGTVGANVTIEGRVYLELMLREPQERTIGFAGAPVIAGGRLVGVLARTPAESREWYALPLDAETIMHLRQRHAARKTRETVETAAAPDFPAHDFFGTLSPSSRRALQHADGMRRVHEQDRIHMEHLVMGLYLKQDGPAERLFQGSGIGDAAELKKVLSQAVELDIPRPDEYELTALTELPPVSKHVEAALRAARTTSLAGGSSQIQSRHLLHGALSVEDCAVIQALRARGVRADAIVLKDEADGDSLAIAVVSCASDTPGGEDLLGIEHEVDALSALIASKDTTTPLSIGLFGDWGSGKSFFMQRMDERIRQFRDAARASPDLPFRQNIVQLWFNAWHYIDQSLWASLGAEIFEGLAQSLAAEEATKDGRKGLEDARTLLVAQRAVIETQHRAAQKAAMSSTAAVQKQEDVIRGIESRTDRQIERSLGTRATLDELLAVIQSQPEIKEDLDRTAKQIGMPELSAATSQLRGQVESLVTMASYWRSVLATARGKAGAKMWVVGVALAAFVLLMRDRIFGMLLGLEGTIAVAAEAVATGIALLGPVLAVAGRATNLIRNTNQRMSYRIGRKRQAELTVAQQALTAAAQTAEEAARRTGQLQEQLAAIDRQIDQLKPVRQLTDFIRARHQSDAYTKHFGVIARARQDFEELTRLMELVKVQPELAATGEGTDHFTPIDRIVLYIDDLDRCPEAKVFEVLQAVHLLLAFPLFVVVVGVDPRWLLHSLRRELGAFRDQRAEEADGSEERLRWQSTPLNYLEKIFQIPFTVRPMDQRGFDRLIEELTRPEGQSAGGLGTTGAGNGSATHPSPTVATPATNGSGADTSSRDGVAQAPDAASTPDSDGSSSSASVTAAEPDRVIQKQALITHNRLVLHKWEAEYMKRLFPLIPSPRASKRFVNVYRLLRAIVTGPKRQELIGTNGQGGYSQVLLLLAMITGYPAETTELIARLLDDESATVPGGDWWAFVDSFKAELDNERSLEPATTAADDANPGQLATGGVRWDHFFEKLDEVRGGMPDQEFSCITMASWAPFVARYSFASGRLLLASE